MQLSKLPSRTFPIDHTCCVTGHRDLGLPWKEDESHGGCIVLKKKIADELLYLYEMEEMQHFISGMALGIDTYFAEAVLELRNIHSEVTLEVAIPCITQAHGWTQPQQERHAHIINQCNSESLISRDYVRSCMMKRNRYMVDHSHIVLAVYDGHSKGGTYNTLKYAKRQGKKCIVLSPEGQYTC